MTRPDLDALAALLDKATPGPYFWFVRECASKDALMLELNAVVDKTAAVNGYDLHGIAVGERDPDADYFAVAHTGCGRRSPENAQFLVAAVNTLPALLAYVRELERGTKISIPTAAMEQEIQAHCLRAALAMREKCAQACNPRICGSQGFAGPSCCVLPFGHAGDHKYGEPHNMSAEDCAAAIRRIEP